MVLWKELIREEVIGGIPKKKRGNSAADSRNNFTCPSLEKCLIVVCDVHIDNRLQHSAHICFIIDLSECC